MSSAPLRLCLLAAVVLATHSPAAAEPLAPEASATAAAELFQEALRDYDRGDLETAIAKLKRAQSSAPHPTVLYNLAQFLEAAGHYGEALRSFEQYLTMLGPKVEPARAQLVQAKLKALRQQVAPVRFEVSPPQASVRVDGQEVEPSSELLLGPGTHQLEASLAGFEPAKLELNAIGGEAQRIVVRLKPVEAPPPVQPTRAVPFSSPTPIRQRAPAVPQTTRTWAIVALASGAALLGGAAVVQVMSSSRREDWQAKDHELNGVDPSLRGDAYWSARAKNAELARSIRHLEGLQLGLFIGAGALTATGVGLWLTSPSSHGSPSAGVTFRRSW